MSKAQIDQLKFDDKNFNKHTEFGMSLLEKSLRENGAGRSILIDKDNNIIAGNGVVEAAGSVGLEKVKIVETDGTEIIAVKRTDVRLDSKQGRKMALADNSTAKADLEWDEENLKEVFTDDELREWAVDDFKPYVEIQEDEPSPVDEENTYSIIGDIYQLGEHRIFCGSFEDDEKVRELFGDKKATCTFTDPPYNVDYVGKTKDALTIKNDAKTRDDFVDFLSRAFNVVAQYTETGGGVISWMSDVELFSLWEAYKKNGIRFKQTILWVKDHFVMGRKDYQFQSEPAIYGIEEGVYDKDSTEDEGESSVGMYARNGGKFQKNRRISNTWFFSRPTSSKFHPTMKPVGLCAKGVLSLSNEGDIVFDPFSGSGSTLIACEQTGRKCYGCEIDPKYCDVIRKRYWKFTTGSEEGWQDGTKAVSA